MLYYFIYIHNVIYFCCKIIIRKKLYFTHNDAYKNAKSKRKIKTLIDVFNKKNYKRNRLNSLIFIMKNLPNNNIHEKF